MEFKSCIFAFFLLFLLLTPCFTRGVPKMDTEIYEIDYRGPETHSYIPPPNRSGGRPSIHHKNVILHRKSKALRAANPGGKGKKIRG